MISRLFKHPARLLLAAGGFALLGLSGPALGCAIETALGNE